MALAGIGMLLCICSFVLSRRCQSDFFRHRAAKSATPGFTLSAYIGGGNEYHGGAKPIPYSSVFDVGRSGP